MQIATAVDEIMQSYLRERVIQKDLHETWAHCNGWTWLTLGIGESYRTQQNNRWWERCAPHIIRRRDLLTGPNGFRNALEVALQLRHGGADSAEIRRMMLDVHWALSAVLDVTDAQLDELLDYDRTFGEGD